MTDNPRALDSEEKYVMIALVPRLANLHHFVSCHGDSPPMQSRRRDARALLLQVLLRIPADSEAFAAKAFVDSGMREHDLFLRLVA